MTNKQTNRGFSLIEVVIATFIISVGVLSISSLQLVSLKNNQSAYYRSQANILAIDILDRMRSNPDGVVAGRYNDVDTTDDAPAAAECLATAAGCSENDIANNDIADWTSRFGNAGLIPASSGTVTFDAGTQSFTVTVQWTEDQWTTGEDEAGNATASRTSNTDTKSVTVVTRV